MNKYTYAELHKIAKQYYKDGSMCAVVACCINCNVSYGKAFNAFKRLGRVTGRATPMSMIKQVYKSFGFNMLDMMPSEFKAKTLMSARKLAATTTQNIAILTSGHISALNHGILVDWSADGACRKRIEHTFLITPILA